MKKYFKNIFLFSVVIIYSFFPTAGFVEADDNFGFNQDPVVTFTGSQYNIVSTLNTPSSLSSYSGYVLLAVLDTDDDFENTPQGPLIDFELVTLPFIFQSTTTVSFQTSDNPDGKFLQYFLMPSNVFAGQTQFSFHPSVIAQAPGVYISTQWHFQSTPPPDDGGNDPDPTTPPCDNPAPDGSCPPINDFDPTPDITPLTNPLGTNFDIINFLDHLFTNFVKIAFPFLVLFMVYSGFLFVEARGNEEKLAAAKENLFYVVIGALIVFSSWTIAHAIKGTVVQLSYVTKILSDIINLV